MRQEFNKKHLQVLEKMAKLLIIRMKNFINRNFSDINFCI
jgi:hypothetical protein